MSEDANPSKPDIVVDDDWKAQVEKEKEALKKKQGDEATADGASQSDSDSGSPESFEMPPASLLVLMSTLATQSMGSMGMFPDPGSGELKVNRPMAKHFIDTLAMLQEKTKGNLTEEESAHLRDALHQLRMAYVALAEKSLAQTTSPTTAEKKTSIELP